MPKIQMYSKIPMVICKGFTLAPAIGVLDWLMIGLTALFIAFIPLLMVGVVFIPMFGGMVSALGIRLNALSMENGKASRTATMPQSRTLTHLGAFFKTSLSISTARISQLADMLMLIIFKKSSFIVNLLS